MKFPNRTFEVDKYCYDDVVTPRDLLNYMYGMSSSHIPEIKNVIFNDPATIVFWEDETKTVVKCQDGDEFDPEKGLAMAIVKKAYGNKSNYCNKLKKWLPKEEQVDTNRILHGISEPSDKFSKSFKRNLMDALDIIFKGAKCTPDDNSASPKKRMTFREEAAKFYPYKIGPHHIGGVLGCPRDMETCPDILGICERTCRACWDREIPDELMNND